MNDLAFLLTTGLLILSPLHNNIITYRPQTKDRVVESLWIGVGSSLDPCGKEGLAHLYEHLVSWSLSGAQPLQVFAESQGVELSAETGKDFITFLLFGPQEQVKSVFQRLLKAASNPTLTAELVEREKELMRQELMANEEDAHWVLRSLLDTILFRQTGYAHPPTGWWESIQSLAPEDVRKFIERAKGAKVFRIRGAQNTLFYDDLTESLGTELVTKVHYCEPLLRRRKKTSGESGASLGWVFPCEGRDWAKWELLALALRERLTQFLSTKREVRNWTLSLRPLRRQVVLSFTATTRSGLVDLPNGVLRVIRDLSDQSVPSSFVQQGIRTLLVDHRLKMVNPIEQVRLTGYGWALFDDPEWMVSYTESLKSVSPIEIQEFARRLRERPPAIFVQPQR
ncbi:MAG: insulinase family protein [Armatimonadota bacterium]|nr:insulinase family protein [Armatimonadota bacterium]